MLPPLVWVYKCVLEVLLRFNIAQYAVSIYLLILATVDPVTDASDTLSNVLFSVMRCYSTETLKLCWTLSDFSVCVVTDSLPIKTCDRRLTTLSRLIWAHRTGIHQSTRIRWGMDWGKVLFSKSESAMRKCSYLKNMWCDCSFGDFGVLFFLSHSCFSTETIWFI